MDIDLDHTVNNLWNAWTLKVCILFIPDVLNLAFQLQLIFHFNKLIFV